MLTMMRSTSTMMIAIPEVAMPTCLVLDSLKCLLLVIPLRLRLSVTYNESGPVPGLLSSS